MRRADRLFQIIQLLRGRRRAVTAADLALKLEVSERTIYRDIRDLMASGTPIQGEAGVGYTLHRTYDLPPLMFDEDEVEALVLGARLVAAYGDAHLARAAQSVLSKVEAVLPKELESRLTTSALYALRPGLEPSISETLTAVRAALAERRKITFNYADDKDNRSQRTVRPLGAFFWGRHWTLTAWCELREDFRTFRVDRMDIEEIGEVFEEDPQQSLRTYIAQYGPEAVAILDR